MLGTEPAPDGRLRGVALAYPGSDVLAHMARRESGYARIEVVIRRDATGEAMTAAVS